MIEQFREDVSDFVKDYNRECDSSSIDELCEYVSEMLLNIGYNKKYIFDRFIRQTICELFPENYGYIYNNFHVEEKPEIVYVPGLLTWPTIFTTIDLAFIRLRSK